MAQQQAKIDEQERLALELANSQKIANLSLSKEREARMLADIGLAEERHSEAASNMADAVLARAKAIVEISGLHEERILKVLEFLNTIQDEEALQQAIVSEKTSQKAEMIDQRDEFKQMMQVPSQQQAQSPQQPQVSANNSSLLGGGL
jgi:superfamily I DNA and RNA helicase